MTPVPNLAFTCALPSDVVLLLPVFLAIYVTFSVLGDTVLGSISGARLTRNPFYGATIDISDISLREAMKLS
jgi:hypothetical protein